MTAPSDGLVRIAAVGDIHVGCDEPEPPCMQVDADVLLVAGDLTRHGTVAEAGCVAEVLANSGAPAIAVLGNHDHHDGRPDEVRACLESRGVTVLEQESTVLDVRGRTVGIVGAKGFGGGFAGACASEFGEQEMKDFVAHTRHIASGISDRLDALEADVRIVLLHYSPVEETLGSEPKEIYPFLGSYLLAEAIDHHGGADLVLHGHAHRGSERGRTPGGARVRNVARPVLRRSHACFEL